MFFTFFNFTKVPNCAAHHILYFFSVILWFKAFSCSKSELKLTEQCEICSRLTIKIPEQCQCRRSFVSIVNFEEIFDIVQLFLLTLNKSVLIWSSCLRSTYKLYNARFCLLKIFLHSFKKREYARSLYLFLLTKCWIMRLSIYIFW